MLTRSSRSAHIEFKRDIFFAAPTEFSFSAFPKGGRPTKAHENRLSPQQNGRGSERQDRSRNGNLKTVLISREKGA
jgi:hypothetical protein